MAVLGISPGNTVIDFGCGEGRYTIPLSQAVGKNGVVYSIERDPTPLLLLNERLPIFGCEKNVTILDTERLEVPATIKNNSCDAVLLFDVLQYITDWKRLFASFSRVLKANGSLHIYPAAVPHPGSVNIDDASTILTALGFHLLCSNLHHMMHNVDMVDDTIYSYSRM